MEIDDPEYPNIGIDSIIGLKNNDASNIYIKQTLLHSPIFTNVFPDFHVHTSKRFRGLPSVTVNDEGEQYLCPQEEDSQFDVFSDDDDLLFNIGKPPSAETAKGSSVEPNANIKLTSIRVIVKTTSILVNDVEFSFSAPIRSSCILRGVMDGQNQEEDSLILSLKSGFLFLIRIYYVPRQYNDTDYDIQGQIQLDESRIFKPFIVQWWDTSSDLSAPALESSGYSLCSHASGLSAVSTSASSVFRIYNCQHTDSGIMFMPHFNIPVDGLILHSCFAEPLNNSIIDNHIMFLIMSFTESRRLELNLYGWSLAETIDDNLTKTSLPLDNSFMIPIFIISLRNNDSFLFVSEKELVIITIHDIMSASYGFSRVPFSGTFPTNYYRPTTAICSQINTKTDEIILSTDNGVIYSIIITGNDIQIRPIMRVSDPISVFSLEKINDEFNLIFGSDTGSSRELYIPELFSEEYLQELNIAQKHNYSSVQLVTDFKNWTPVLDVLIIDSYKSRSINNRSDQELWALTGIGRRTRLTQLRNGYNATRRSKTYEQLRKTDQLYFITLRNKFYLFCSLPFETKVLEYQPEMDEYLVEIEDAAIDISNSSLLVRNISRNQDILIQITQCSIALTNLFDLSLISRFEDKRILFCDMHKGFLAMITESTKGEKCISLKLFKINNEINFNANLEYNGALDLVGSLDINYQPSMIRLIELNMSTYIITGSYDGSLFIYQLNLEPKILEYKEYFLNDFNPYENNNLRENFIIPNDSVQSLSPRTNFYVGSKDGYYIHFYFDTNLTLECKNFLKIGDTPVRFLPVHNESKMVFILSRSLWLLNLYDSEFPTQVYFDERHDRAISTMVQLPDCGQENIIGEDAKYFGFVREEGFTFGSVLPFKKPNIRQINIAESAKKLTYLPHLSTFVILCNSKDPRVRLKFVDRKALKTLQHHELNSRLKNLDLDEFIFGMDEMPMAACIWSIKRQDRISKKLLIGSTLNESSGSFKVLDITRAQDLRDSPVYIRVTELTSFEHKEPITHIQQIESSILFSSGRTIYSTTYDIDERRLKPVSALVTLTSDIISLSVENNKLLVTTKLDSIFQFIYNKNTDNDSDILKLIYKDPTPKSIVNQAELNENIIAGDKLHSSILIMNTTDNNLKSLFSYKMSSIPRVYASKFNSYWVDHNASEGSKAKHGNSNILCVGINGEITSIRLLSSGCNELKNLAKSLKTGRLVNELIESFIEVLNRPFIDKITGKGLSSINKPHFNYKDNKGKLIDYDLDEISKLCNINVSI